MLCCAEDATIELKNALGEQEHECLSDDIVFATTIFSLENQQHNTIT